VEWVGGGSDKVGLDRSGGGGGAEVGGCADIHAHAAAVQHIAFCSLVLPCLPDMSVCMSA
jgi:hypothetical protein